MTLPNLIEWSGKLDHYDQYIDEAYERFLNIFKSHKSTYLGKPVRPRRNPISKGKHHTFWHITSKSGDEKGEENRLPCLNRCARIHWIGYILENHADNDNVYCWTNIRRSRKHGSQTNHLLYLHQQRYVVILAEKDWGFLLVTAYITNNRTHKKFLKEHRNSKGL